jgi:hypothetical protein
MDIGLMLAQFIPGPKAKDIIVTVHNITIEGAMGDEVTISCPLILKRGRTS